MKINTLGKIRDEMTMFQKMKKFMDDNSYTHTDEWLMACMEWIGSNFNNISEAEYQKQVREQWIDVNLEELGSGCLPLNLAAQKCTKLTRNFALQMNSAQDIGESSYNQWKQIKKLENENTNVTAASETDTAWAPKPRRCLYLTLTDGRQEVYGLELVPIPALSLSTLKPGVKILLTGPIECRRGVLQLRPSNVKIIGGEVESMLDSHSVEAQISQRLNIPRGGSATSSTGIIPRRNSPPVARPPHSTVTTIMDTDDGGFPDDLDDDDDLLFMEIDENILLQGGGEERNPEPDPPRPLPRNSRTIETQDGRPKPKQLKIDRFMKPMPVVIKPPTPVAVRTAVTIPEASGSANTALDDIPKRKTSSNQSTVTGIIHPIVSSSPSPMSYPVKVSGLPYIYIKQIKENMTVLAQSGRNVYVKVCVTTVISQIKVVNGVWALTVCINDGTDSLRCELSSELLNLIIGFDPVIMKRLKSLKTADSKQQIMLGMNNLTARLVHLNAIVEIQLNPEPTIVNITDVAVHHVDALKERLSVLKK